MRRRPSPVEVVAVQRGEEHKSRRVGGVTVRIPPGQGNRLSDTEGEQRGTGYFIFK